MIYDNYVGKHFARMKGLSTASKKYVKATGKDRVKYFTLCAVEAIDVFMLEKDKVLKRDPDGKLTGVIVCESKAEDADRIFRAIKPPLFESIIVGPLQDIVLFEDDEQTSKLKYDDDVADRIIRNKLRLKEQKRRLIREFPFDIINFDTYGNILGCEEDDLRLMNCFIKILELQKNADSFILSITLPIDKICDKYSDIFKKCINLNIKDHKEIKSVIEEKWKTLDYNKIDENNKIALAFSKAILIKAANNLNWHSNHESLVVYESEAGTRMLASVVNLVRSETPLLESYKQDIVNIVRSMPQFISYQSSLRMKTVIDNLQKIIKYRDKIQKELSER